MFSRGISSIKLDAIRACFHTGIINTRAAAAYAAPGSQRAKGASVLRHAGMAAAKSYAVSRAVTLLCRSRCRGMAGDAL